jgi:beta-lactam-binding protein with PASTA domain
MTKERTKSVARTVGVILSGVSILLVIFGFILSGNSRTAVNEVKIEKLEQADSKNTLDHEALKSQFHVIDKKLDVLIESIKE